MPSNSSLKRLNRPSLAASTADYLQEAIIGGAIALGQRLLEVDISEQLGISRGTLREALQTLESEGIVESSPGRGKYVMSLSERDIQEIYVVRSVLEQEAARLAAKKISQKDIAELQSILQSMFKAARDQDIKQVINCDFDLHQKIWHIADNCLLQQVLHSIAQKAKIYLAIQIKLYDDLVIGLADHEYILEAISNQDGEEAAALMKEHMTYASQAVVEYARHHQNQALAIESD